MKLIHLSDLHLGKRLYEMSLIEDQRFILKQILEAIDRERPDAVIIAGDVYDKSVPSAEAVSLFDEFLSELANGGLNVFVISGNHDSAERISSGSRIMKSSGIFLSEVYSGNVRPIVLSDDFGEVNFYLLPFVKPANVRAFFDEEINSYTDAIKLAVAKMNVDYSKRNVLITHQFITGSRRSDSEEISVGGTDNVDSSAVDGFDYVALGHIHSPQNCGSEKIRYCGTPLKYSLSEINDQKSITVVELSEKGNVNVREIFLTPKRELREVRGKYEGITLQSFYKGTSLQDDYVHIVLTDEDDIPDAIGKLRTIYHFVTNLTYDNERTRRNSEIDVATEVESKTPFELFSEFFEIQNNKPMTDEQKAFVKKLIEKTWEENL
ncbi:MAG: exonuclease SbcCD subunit D [Clostridia bacterium]|nr:exonuclease SbcCD subunit D [Clostridia bacterium]